ncbi:MAG: hypothetical protein RMI56_02720 [Sulfolobales archaeon]|nr:hypothetical protein [Sulfolobales archaeon]MDW8082692.1 hypothetical protein [Sulfolobales archaeon]
MSELRRYLPIQDVNFGSTTPTGNFSAIERESPVLQAIAELLEPAAAPLGIIAVLILLALAALFLSTIWYGRDVERFAEHRTIRKLLRDMASEEAIEYTYTGIKLTLRKYYLRLRESVGCRRCTPREIVEKYGRREFEKFAKIYEDVVYGSKEVPADDSKVLVELDDSL